jgi:hypothetical protein
MQVQALRSLLERRWQGAAAHGVVQAATAFPSGIPSLDAALAGLPIGRLTEIFGDRSSGKTTLAYGMIARATRLGDICAWIDAQRGFFAPAAEAAGIVLKRVIVVRPHDAAGCRRAIDAAVRSGACAIVVVDETSAQALQTHHCARLVSQAEKTATILLALSQGASQPLASFASLRIRTSGLAPFWQAGTGGMHDGRLAGYHITCEVVKSKVGMPGARAAFAAELDDVTRSWPGSQVRAAQEFLDRACTG